MERFRCISQFIWDDDDESTLEDVVVDNIPRLSGDNDVLFDPDASFAQYLDRFGNNLDQISARFNFGDGPTRLEPENHGLQPILCEFQILACSDGRERNIALAMYPSVASEPLLETDRNGGALCRNALHYVAMNVTDPVTMTVGENGRCLPIFIMTQFIGPLVVAVVVAKSTAPHRTNLPWIFVHQV